MKILYIEDDINSIKIVNNILKKHYIVDYEMDGKIGLLKAEINSYDLLIIDINLPNKNGLDLCKELRMSGKNTPIIFLTSNKQKEFLLNGFKNGGDDYLEKPFNKDELFFRIKSLLKRQDNKYIYDIIKYNNFYLDTNSKKLFFKKTSINLTKKEYNILELFFRNQNIIFNKYKLFDQVWDYNDTPFSNIVEVFIKNIRKKIKKTTNTTLIKSIRNVGYYIGKID